MPKKAASFWRRLFGIPALDKEAFPAAGRFKAEEEAPPCAAYILTAAPIQGREGRAALCGLYSDRRPLQG
ncbi:hypothetical protein CE91St46_27160 [Eubacteriales bacterium]|nr:hypothetical protein CE91St46_27160 [Eubacteriales bacterium]GKH64324.1 hypothetical protein CE91St47_27930 [Eubacteriales bacterium]